MRPVSGKRRGGGEGAVDHAAEGGPGGGGLGVTVLPILEEEAGDAVAHCEAGDVAADGGDDACAVRAGDAGEGHLRVVGAEDGHEVAEVEAGEVEVDEDFVGTGGGEGALLENEMVDAKGGDGEGGGLHKRLDVGRWVGVRGI